MIWIARLVPEHGGVLLLAHLLGLMLTVSVLAWLAATIFARRPAPRRRLIYVSALIVLL